MRLLIAAFVILLILAFSGFASVNVNRHQILLKPTMKHMGIHVFGRKLAASIKPEATYSQSDDLLTITVDICEA